MLSNRIARLVAPPRWVPLSVVCSAMLGWVGGFGAFFFFLGMVFVWIFAGDFGPLDEWRLAHSTTTARATVTGVTATSATENDVQVYEYRFTFMTPAEETVTGHAYSTGQVWSVGDRVTVWYVPERPAVARLDKTRLSTFQPWVFLFVFIFPLVGAAMLASATVRGWRQVILLRYGKVAGARTISSRATNVQVNHRPVLQYTYEFQGQDWQTYSGSCQALSGEAIGDEAQEPVLYLPSNPRSSVLVDALPLRYTLDVDDAGQWVSYEGVGPVVWCGLAWMGVLVHVVYGLWRLCH